jgi:hypothetical protein
MAFSATNCSYVQARPWGILDHDRVEPPRQQDRDLVQDRRALVGDAFVQLGQASLAFARMLEPRCFLDRLRERRRNRRSALIFWLAAIFSPVESAAGELLFRPLAAHSTRRLGLFRFASMLSFAADGLVL